MDLAAAAESDICVCCINIISMCKLAPAHVTAAVWKSLKWQLKKSLLSAAAAAKGQEQGLWWGIRWTRALLCSLSSSSQTLLFALFVHFCANNMLLEDRTLTNRSGTNLLRRDWTERVPKRERVPEMHIWGIRIQGKDHSESPTSVLTRRTRGLRLVIFRSRWPCKRNKQIGKNNCWVRDILA